MGVANWKLHAQPRLELRPEAGHIREVEEDENGRAQVEHVDLRASETGDREITD